MKPWNIFILLTEIERRLSFCERRTFSWECQVFQFVELTIREGNIECVYRWISVMGGGRQCVLKFTTKSIPIWTFLGSNSPGKRPQGRLKNELLRRGVTLEKWITSSLLSNGTGRFAVHVTWDYATHSVCPFGIKQPNISRLYTSLRIQLSWQTTWETLWQANISCDL